MNHATPQDERVAHIIAKANELVALAEIHGVTLTISLAPCQPLAMGNTVHVVDAWPARHGPRPPGRARPAP